MERIITNFRIKMCDKTQKSWVNNWEKVITSDDEPVVYCVMNKIGKATVVVYGVATDYCIKAAVLGLCKLGYEVIVAEDSITGIEGKTTYEAIELMKFKGAVFKKTKVIINGLQKSIKEN